MATVESVRDENAPDRPRPQPPAVDESEVLNWDVAIAVPPVRPRGTIRVRLRYRGRAKPLPVEDPSNGRRSNDVG
jgi:hypothetical protein